MKKRIKTVQTILNEKGMYEGAIDGIAGPKTMAALASVDGMNHDLPKTRQITTFIQMAANEKNFDAGPVHGLWGQRTEAAFDGIVFLLDHGMPQPPWRPDEIEILNPNKWPVQHSDGFNEFFGEKDSQLTIIELPYEMKLAWDLRLKVRRMSCHKKTADSISKILQKVKEIYGEENINGLHLNSFGGCLNDRKMRNGSLLSMHAWGIALDFYPDQNKLKWGRHRAAFAHPDYDEWWKCWEEEGWISLGRKRNFDWMHVQAARLPE